LLFDEFLIFLICWLLVARTVGCSTHNKVIYEYEQ